MEQDAEVQPFAHEQVQLHGPEPETELAFPEEQRFVDGALTAMVQLAEPQTPEVAERVVEETDPSTMAPVELEEEGFLTSPSGEPVHVAT